MKLLGFTKRVCKFSILTEEIFIPFQRWNGILFLMKIFTEFAWKPPKCKTGQMRLKKKKKRVRWKYSPFRCVWTALLPAVLMGREPLALLFHQHHSLQPTDIRTWPTAPWSSTRSGYPVVWRRFVICKVSWCTAQGREWMPPVSHRVPLVSPACVLCAHFVCLIALDQCSLENSPPPCCAEHLGGSAAPASLGAKWSNYKLLL